MRRGKNFIDFESWPDVDLPFKMQINFSPIINYYEKLKISDNPVKREIAEKLLSMIDKTPRLREPFINFSELWDYEEPIHGLLDVFFAELLTTNEIKAASMPFIPFFFRTSKRLQNILDIAGDDFQFIPRQFDTGMIYILASTFALNVVHGAGLSTSFPMYVDIPDNKNGTIRHFRILNNADFASIRPNGKPLELTEEDFIELSENYMDLELWKSKIPPNSFIFEGFGLTTLVDLTMDESISSMKNILLQKNALFQPELVQNLEQILRNFFNENSLDLGIAQYHQGKQQISLLRENMTHCIFLTGKKALKADECFCDNSFYNIFEAKQPIVFSNIELIKKAPSPLVTHYKESGIKSAIILPLLYDEKVIGILELTSKKANVINSMFAYKMQEVLPLFTIALQRAIDEQQTKLEAFVQEKFTSLHPTVAWKFFDVAKDELDEKRSGLDDDGQIVFHDVVPIYGQFDIRGSSHERNLAIQQDLTKQLNMAGQVFKKAREKMALPIYKSLEFRISKYKDSLTLGMHAGDEVSILEFLSKEVYPAFHYMAAENEVMKQAVDDYMAALDPKLKVVYEERKAYETTVTMINDVLGSYVDKHQDEAQKMLPHYFEKYKTDGIEYNIYVGQSLLQSRKYDPIHLQNFRLWQLLMTIGAEQEMQKIRKKLPKPLDISSLILVHSSPLSIRFRMDEKKFDVDGAYNIRYEIVKKRIDKAYIKGENERLTQPGKIAIVYTQDWEAEEYKRYIEYLQYEGLLKDEIEHLDLEDLQGTTGLRALRVSLDPDSSLKKSNVWKQLEEMSADLSES